jgi:hypothetical protein
MLKVPKKRHRIIDWRACIRVASFWTWNKGISRADGIGAVGAVGTVNADSTLPLAHGPLNGVQDQAEDKVKKKPRQVHVEGFFFLFGKLGLNFFIFAATAGWLS